MKKDKGILRTAKDLGKQPASKKVILKIRDSQDTNCTRNDDYPKRLQSTPFLKEPEDFDDQLRSVRKSTTTGDRRPRLKCMTPTKSLPALSHEGRMLSSVNKNPSFPKKSSIKFNLRTVNVMSYSSPGQSNKSLQNGMLIMKGRKKVDCNCCQIY